MNLKTDLREKSAAKVLISSITNIIRNQKVFLPQYMWTQHTWICMCIFNIYDMESHVLKLISIQVLGKSNVCDRFHERKFLFSWNGSQFSDGYYLIPAFHWLQISLTGGQAGNSSKSSRNFNRLLDLCSL